MYVRTYVRTYVRNLDQAPLWNFDWLLMYRLTLSMC